jgi:hypothetical protein
MLSVLAKDRLLKFWPELQIRVTQLAREGAPPPGVRQAQAKLSRNSNQIARGRIRRESYMPSQAVWSPPPKHDVRSKPRGDRGISPGAIAGPPHRGEEQRLR